MLLSTSHRTLDSESSRSDLPSVLLLVRLLLLLLLLSDNFRLFFVHFFFVIFIRTSSCFDVAFSTIHSFKPSNIDDVTDGDALSSCDVTSRSSICPGGYLERTFCGCLSRTVAITSSTESLDTVRPFNSLFMRSNVSFFFTLSAWVRIRSNQVSSRCPFLIFVSSS